MKFLQKIASRKFIVFIIATVSFYLKMLTGAEWIIIALIWVGGNSLDKFIRLKGGNSDYKKL